MSFFVLVWISWPVQDSCRCYYEVIHTERNTTYERARSLIIHWVSGHATRKDIHDLAAYIALSHLDPCVPSSVTEVQQTIHEGTLSATSASPDPRCCGTMSEKMKVKRNEAHHYMDSPGRGSGGIIHLLCLIGRELS